MRQVFIALLLLFFIGHKTSAQNFSNKGTEFWTVFAPHEPGSSSASANKMTLFFTTDTATTVTVTIGGVQVTGSPVSLTPGVISSLDINVSNRLASPEGLYTQKGINIKSTKNIVAYAQIYGSSVAGASVLFPLQTLGRSYTSLNYKQISNETDARSFCVVVATEDNTTVQVNPSGLTEGGTLVPNQFNTTTNQKTLNKGDCWLIQGKVVSSASTSNVDLTGTQIRSVSNSSGACKPIAVFCGSSKISITCSNSSASSDNLFQQAFPKAAWGKKYVSAPTAGTNYNYNVYRVMLDPDAGTTTVKINGITLPSTVAGLGTATTPTGIGTNTISLTTTANGTNYYEFVTSIPVNIEATNPIMVAQYITNKSNCSNNYSPNAGDPDMIYLSPVEQTIDKITVAPVPTSNSSASNYVNVVMKTADVSSFQIRNQSGTLLTSSFNPITANPLYSYSQIALANGYSSTTYYTLSTTNSSGFNAVAYGYDQSESYAYNAGTNVKNLYQSINSNNPNSTVANSTICKNTPTLLSITLPFLPTSFIWDFNSNPKITPNANVTRPTPVTYDSTYTIDGKDFYVFKMPSLTTFTEAGVYPIKIIVNNPTPDGCDGTQTITFDVNVYNGPKASFSTSSNFCVNNILSFTNNSTDSIGRPLVRWEWDFGDTQTDNTQNTSHAYAIANTYNVSIRVYNDYGCYSDTTKQITIVPKPSTPIVTTPINYCQNETASLLNATGNNLLWYTSSSGGFGSTTTPIPTTSAFGTNFYYVTQTINNCESNRAEIIVNINAIPSAPVLSVVNNCGNSTLTASGITGTITWSDGGSGNPRNVTNSASYSLTQTVNGCTSSSSNIVTTNPASIPSAPTLSVTNNCGNSTLTASGITGTIIWSDGGSGNPRTVTNSASYSLSQTANGCTSSSSNTVTTNPTPIPSAPTLSITNNCGNSTLTASGITGTITWSDGGNGNPRTVTNSASYSLTQTVNGCTSSSSNIITTNPATVPSAPVLSVVNNCGNSTLTASGITGTITWSDGGSGNPRNVTNSASYSLTQTVNGCTSSSSNIVTTNPTSIPSAPTLSVTNNCGNSTLTASGIAGTITWSDGGSGNPRTVTNYASYSLTQTVNGCTSSSSNIVTTTPGTPPAIPILSVVNNCGNSTLTATNVTGVLTWSDGGSGNPRIVTNSSIYSLTQTVSGCTSSSSNTVTTSPTHVPSAPTLSVVNNCGNSTLTASGITGTITWSDGGSGNPRTVTNSTSYSLTQTVNGCTSSSSNTVTTNPTPIPSAPKLSVLNNCGNSTLTATNFTGTLTWSDGGSGNPRAVTNSASYSIIQTVNGCNSNSSNTVTTAPITIPSAPTLSVINNCGNSTLTATNFTGTLTWSDGGSGNPRTVTNSASYSITQTVNGCNSNSSNTVTTAPITIPPAPVLSVVNDCGISTLTASGIVGHINWSDGGNGNPRTVTINNSYSLTQNIGKCTSAVSNVVTSAPLAIPNPPVLSVINNCGNSTITASNVTGILTWNDGGTGNPRTVTINNSYSVSQTVGGCISSLSNIVVSVPKQIPSPPILSVLDNCGSSTLTANNVVGTLTWNDGGSGNPRSVNNAASFSLTQNLNGCESSTSNVVTTNPKTFPPAPNVTSPISYCQNATATALAAIGSNILWYNVPTGGIGSSTPPIPSTNTQGFFNFYASQTVNGCEGNLATIQVNILALPTPANISPTGLIELCDGKTITLHSSYATGNQWLKNGNEVTGAINDSLVITTSGDFSIKITNTDGCQSISNIVTTILHPLPSVFAGADKYIYEGDSTQLNATASGGLLFSYKWNPKVYLTSDTILKPWTIKPPFDISYKLTVTNEKGCSSSDDVLVHVINKLIIPNVFSPNGDKVNDTWEIKNINTNPFCTVDVYDRNGQVVYHSGGYSKPWDGTYHGKNVPNGVYYYIISEGKNIPLKSGTVTLLR